MVGFIYGRTGSGKSEWIFSHMEKTAEKGHVFLLVPDREAVAAESRAAELPYAGNIDVVTFGRLCNYVFRRYGGLCADYITSGAKKLLMRNVLRGLAPMLKEYGAASGLGIAEKLTATRSELYQDKILPNDLERASEKLGEETPLGAKLADLSLIFAAFDAEVSSRWEDPDGILSVAHELLRGRDFFDGSTVYIDSFTSFSPQQYDLIGQMMAGADDVYITLSYLQEEAEEASARHLAVTDRLLRRAAERTGVKTAESISLRTAKRYKSEELAFLSNEIAGDGVASAVWNETPRDIVLTRAANAFAEAEAAAIDICRTVRRGARYRDIAVIVRDTSTYEGILDAVFRKYEIPYFLSSRKKITEKPLIKLIYAAFAVCERGFRGQDVISYIKTGFVDVTPGEAGLLENYIIKWNIRGKLFTGDEPWNMHPRGYGAPFTETDNQMLARLADIRRRVIEPLKAFYAAGRTAKTVRERATLLYDFLAGLGVPEALMQSAKVATERGEAAAASETVQLWNVFCGALDQLVVCSGETDASATEFSQMLLVILSETDIGKIPTSVDEVTISGAAQTVPGAHRFVYLIGANEGNFPKRAGEDGLFSEFEKERLSVCGVELTSRLARHVSEELFYFNRAASLPSERLYVSFSHYGLSGSEERESVGVKRIRKLFPLLTVRDFELSDKRDLIESRAASFELATSLSGNLGQALRDYYEAKPSYAEWLKYIRMPLSAANCKLSPECAENMFGGGLTTSYTKLEKYIKCHFAYFCEYELKLRDDTPARFDNLNVGNFMHGVLEKTVRWIAEGGDSDIDEAVRQIAADYIDNTFHVSGEAIPRRLRRLFDYLCRSAAIFARRIKAEFEVSQFRPRDFELVVGQGGGVLPMTLEGDGMKIELRGKIDRVDAYEGGDGKLYLRVIDYKTGDKQFSIDNVHLGLDMQMLLYLFSLWEKGASHYGGKEIVPAAVVYAGVKPPEVESESGIDKISVKMSGLFLDDEAVLRAMDPALKGDFIPVKENKDGAIKGNLIGLDAFSELRDEVTATVLRYAEELKRGAAGAVPFTATGTVPCEYCKMRAVCRIYKTPQAKK